MASKRKQVTVELLLDTDVLDWFKAQSEDYKSHINVVLRAFVEAEEARKQNG